MTSHNGTVPLITQVYFTGDPAIAKDPWSLIFASIALLCIIGLALYGIVVAAGASRGTTGLT